LNNKALILEKGLLNNYFISASAYQSGIGEQSGQGTDYTPALQDLLRSFPYFQLAQVMYAKKMYEAHEPEAVNRIKLASVYAPDRKFMYTLFKKEPDVARVETPVVKTIEQKVKREEKPLPIVKRDEVKINYVYNSPVPTKVEPNPLSETFIKKESEAKIAPIVSETKKAEPIIRSQQAVSSGQSEQKAETPKPVKQAPIEPAQEEIDIHDKHSFDSWLKALPEIKEERRGYKPTASGHKQKELIDKFLADSPRISRPKAEFFSPYKAAKQSNTEDFIVSETLAKIYFEQGNLQKALKAYQTLLAENPEKKSIFAARIEEIKTLINKF
jgi:hypothetical protein